MSYGRVSTNYAFIRSMRNIGESFTRLDELREKLNTGKEISKPSDDPVGLQQVFSLGSSVRENVRYQENIDRAMGRLNATSSTLERVEDVLLELQELATLAASDTATSVERSAQATQVELLLEELVNLANAKHQGNFLFGGVNTLSGSASLSQPYNLQRAGDGFISGVVQNPRGINVLMQTTIMNGLNESMNISGAVAFQPNGVGATGDIFNDVITFRDNLRSNNLTGLEASALAIKNAIEQVVEQNTIVGGKISKLDKTQSTLESIEVNELEEKSQIEDADYAKILLEYSTQETVFNATLSATSTILQNSLLNFI